MSARTDLCGGYRVTGIPTATATRCDHLGVRQRSLRSCRLGRHVPTARPARRERTRRHRCLGTADLERQVCATPSFREEPTRPVRGNPLDSARGAREACHRKKILNRGNELKVVLKTKGLAGNAPLKRTPSCASKVTIKAKKSAISVQKTAGDAPFACYQPLRENACDRFRNTVIPAKLVLRGGGGAGIQSRDGAFPKLCDSRFRRNGSAWRRASLVITRSTPVQSSCAGAIPRPANNSADSAK